MVAKVKKVPTAAVYTVEVDENVLVGLYCDWHAMHALRCEVGHGRAADALNAGAVQISLGYMTEGANVGNVFGDGLSDADYDRIVQKVEAHMKAHSPVYELGALAQGGRRVEVTE